MPELPEVESARRSLEPHVLGRRIAAVCVRESRLRWPVTPGLTEKLSGRVVRAVRRRGKYLLFDLDRGHLLVHYGMTGSLTVCPPTRRAAKHDHIDLLLDGGTLLRFHDPRRFGAVLWVDEPARHPLLATIGVEPLEEGFNAQALARLARGRRQPIKSFLMDGRVVAGVGNIYASEALFAAGVRPSSPAGRLSKARWERVARAVVDTLSQAIDAGGSTLRDFVGGDGKPGSYQESHAVYGRDGQPCPRCGGPIRLARHSGRSTFYCPRCQR